MPRAVSLIGGGHAFYKHGDAAEGLLPGDAQLPVIEAGARERALRDLVETIQRVKGRRDVAIRISGPAALLEALKAPLASAELAVELAAGDGIDLTATIGDTLIETRIGAWGERLKAALGGRSDG